MSGSLFGFFILCRLEKQGKNGLLLHKNTPLRAICAFVTIKAVIRMTVWNFGSCNIDLVYRLAHIVAPGETISATALDRYPGGKGLNQSVALARAGCPVRHAGCIGEDGQWLRTLLAEAGADVRELQTVQTPTGHAIIQVAEDGENSIVLFGGANRTVSPADVDRVLAQAAPGDLLLLQNEISSLPYIIRQAAAKGLQVVLNPSPLDETVAAIDLHDITWLILNEVEAAAIGRGAEPREFLQQTIAAYPQLHIVLTLGKDGCLYADAGQLFRQPAYTVTPVDTTAAGDTFTGYFIAAISRGDPPQAAAQLAAAAAAISTTRPGAACSIPTLAQVQAALPTMRPRAGRSEDAQKALILSYIAHAYAAPSLEALAGQLCYSTPYASRWIRKNMGESFMQLVRRERCRHAKRLLANTDASLAEICRTVGYGNETRLRRDLRAFYDLSPKEIRKKGD